MSAAGQPRRRRPPRSAQEGRLGGEHVEGRRAVHELLAAGTRQVREVLVAEGRDPSPLIEEIVALARTRRVSCHFVGPAVLAAHAVTDSHQGVLARAEPLHSVGLDLLLERVPPFLVVLDGVTDPRNLGSILRSALCAGATGAILPAHRSARISPAAAKAAAGAVEHLPMALVGGIPAALEQLSRRQVWTVALDAAGDHTIDELEIATQGVALILGAEGKGISQLARRRCDLRVRIPLEGPLGSLNVAAATAVACFAVAARRRQG